MVVKSIEFLRNFSKLSLKTVIPQKFLGDQFRGFSWECHKNQLQEMILEKFLRNSSKKFTTVGESGKIPHLYYLGYFLFSISNLNIMNWIYFLKNSISFSSMIKLIFFNFLELYKHVYLPSHLCVIPFPWQ